MSLAWSHQKQLWRGQGELWLAFEMTVQSDRCIAIGANLGRSGSGSHGSWGPW